MFAQLCPDQTNRPAPRPAQELPAQARGVLNALRMIAMDCRAKSRADVFEACALLSGQPSLAQDAHASALIRCFRQVLGVRPVFYHPGSVQMSFDEAWLMRAVLSCRAQDWRSFEFLLRSRIPQMQRRSMAFLIHGISDRFGRF